MGDKPPSGSGVTVGHSVLSEIIQTRVSKNVAELLKREAETQAMTVATLVRRIIYRHYKVFPITKRS